MKKLWILVIVLICATGIPISAAPWTEYRITTSPAGQYFPDIEGNTVVWADIRLGTDVYAADISDPNNPVEFIVVSEPYSEKNPKVGGSFVFFLGTEGPCIAGYSKINVYGHNLNTQKTSQITNFGCAPGGTSSWSLGGNDGATVVWVHSSNVSGYDIETNSLFGIAYTYMQGTADVSDNIVVWADNRNDNADIYGFDMSIWQDFPITTNPEWQYYPAISQNIVVWQDYRNGNSDIYGADITDPCNPIHFAICTDANEQSQPDISGNIIVWEDNRNGNEDIYGYDLSTETEFQITDNTSTQRFPAINGHTVVWEDWRHGHGDIYATILYGPIVPRCTSPVQGDINGDCKVNFADFVLMLNNWLECNLDPPEACWQ